MILIQRDGFIPTIERQRKRCTKTLMKWWVNDAEKSEEPGICGELIEKVWPFDNEEQRK
jgi:hypothetical protein